jgi:hypothetical protein
MMIVIMKLRVWIMIDILNTSKWYEIHRNEIHRNEIHRNEIHRNDMKYIKQL